MVGQPILTSNLFENGIQSSLNKVMSARNLYDSRHQNLIMPHHLATPMSFKSRQVSDSLLPTVKITAGQVLQLTLQSNQQSSAIFNGRPFDDSKFSGNKMV